MGRPLFNLKNKATNAINGISKSSFKNSSLLIIASVTAQIVNFLCYPFITRSINPDEFGKYALLLSCVSVFTVFSFGRLELLFPKYKTKQERFELLSACGTFFLFTTFILVLALQFSGVLFSFARMNRFDHWGIMVLASFVSMSLLNLMNNYQVGVGSFKILSILRLLQPIATIVITLSMLKFTQGYPALFWGFNLGNLICLLIGVWDLLFVQKEMMGQFNWPRVKGLFRENKKMIVINSPHALIDSVQTNLLNVVISRYYTVASVGNYSLANRLVRAPMSTVGGAISQVFYKDIHDYESSSNELKAYVKKVLFILLFLSIIVMGALVVFLKLFFVKIFGANWAGVVPIVLALVPWVIANFVSSPLSQITIYKNRQGSAIIFGAFYNGLTLLSLFIFGILQYNLVENIFWTSCLGGILNVIFILWILRILQDE